MTAFEFLPSSTRLFREDISPILRLLIVLPPFHKIAGWNHTQLETKSAMKMTFPESVSMWENRQV